MGSDAHIGRNILSDQGCQIDAHMQNSRKSQPPAIREQAQDNAQKEGVDPLREITVINRENERRKHNREKMPACGSVKPGFEKCIDDPAKERFLRSRYKDCEGDDPEGKRSLSEIDSGLPVDGIEILDSGGKNHTV